MEKLGIIHQLIIPFLGYNIKINLEVIIMTWTVFVVLIVFGLFASRKKDLLPRPIQVLGELIVATFYQLTEDALGREMAKKYSPLICALFMFLLLSNWLGIIPYLEEPTKDLNTPLSLGIKNIFNRSFS
jgi:F-type H+-transporting ATPase subunit a